MKFKNQYLIALIALPCFVMPIGAHPQAEPIQDAAIDNTVVDDSEPTLDDLLGLGDEGDKPDADDDGQVPGDNEDPSVDDDAGPELTRDLEKRLTSQEASDQFAQAIEEMAEVATRLGDEGDPGIDTQRIQDEIILKLEQIIASAEPQQSNQPPKPGQPHDGPPREADQGGQPQPGQQPGEKPGQQQGQKPGEQGQQANGEQPGEQEQGQQQGEGQQPGEQQANGSESGDNTQQGSVRNAELSMKDLREGEWGNLPPRLRDELAESLSETFNPVYRAATEAFYRRIAELSEQEAESSE